MFLMVSVEILIDDFLGLPFRTRVYGEFSKVTERSTRQVSECFRKKSFSYSSEKKIQAWLEDHDIEFLDGFPVGADVAAGWAGLANAALKLPSVFLPRTHKLIQNLVQKDISFHKRLHDEPQKSHLIFYKQYLEDEVIPFYCNDVEGSIDQLDSAETLDQMRQLLPGLLFESVLHLLAHAESEYLLAYCSDYDSVLAKTLSGDADMSLSPSKQFFNRWMKTLGLDGDGKKKEIIACMFADFDEAGISAEEDGSESLMTSVALEKQIQRYLNNGDRAKLDIVGKWAKGLYWKASEVQGRNEGCDDYSGAMMEIYGGVLILDKLCEEGEKIFRKQDLQDIMQTYQDRFNTHLVEMKKEVAEMTTSL